MSRGAPTDKTKEGLEGRSALAWNPDPRSAPDGGGRGLARSARGRRPPRPVPWPRPSLSENFARGTLKAPVADRRHSAVVSWSPDLSPAHKTVIVVFLPHFWMGCRQLPCPDHSLVARFTLCLRMWTACKLIASCSPRACEPEKELYHRSKGTWPQSSRRRTNRVKDLEIEWIETLKGFTCGLVHRWTSPHMKPA